jgi:hypothetical protein
MPALSSSAPENAAIEMGVSCRLVSRFSAVITTSASASESWAPATPAAPASAAVASHDRRNRRQQTGFAK